MVMKIQSIQMTSLMQHKAGAKAQTNSSSTLQTTVVPRTEGSSILLSQLEVAELFQTIKQNISLHVKVSLKMVDCVRIQLSRNP